MPSRFPWERQYLAAGGNPRALLNTSCCQRAPTLYNRMFDAFQRRCILRLLEQTGPLTHKRVLDLGCGWGRWNDALRERGALVLGGDLSHAALKNAREHSGLGSAVQMSAARLALRGRCLDGIISVTVLQHLSREDQAAAILEVGRCVKPGGFALVLEHTHPGKRKDQEEQGATFANSPAEWVERFRRGDFQLVRMEPCLFLPIFQIYWKLKGILRTTLGPRTEPHRNRGSQAAGSLSKIHFFSYLLLTPPSYLLESLLDGLPALRSWASKRLPAAHHIFLFRKEGLDPCI